MRLSEKTSSQLRFDLPRQELQLFHVILSIYPMHPNRGDLPSPPHPPGAAPDPELLESTLQDLKSENKQRLDSFISRTTPEPPFSDTTANPRSACSLEIGLDEIDFLLQVLNEIRVGCWYELGCPDESVEALSLENPEAAQRGMIMMFSGMFQETLIHAVNTSEP